MLLEAIYELQWVGESRDRLVREVCIAKATASVVPRKPNEKEVKQPLELLPKMRAGGLLSPNKSTRARRPLRAAPRGFGARPRASPTLRPPANPRVLGFALMGGRNVAGSDVRRNISWPK